MSVDNRAMTVAQARALAADPNVAPAVMVRLANGYPEVWSVLLENPSVYPELRQWLEAAMAPPVPVADGNAVTEVIETKAAVSSSAKPARRASSRWRRRRSNATKMAGVIIPPILVVIALFVGVGVVFAAHPEPGVITTEATACSNLTAAGRIKVE